jgi:ABC-type phosphate transport system substrate-binding protein
MGGRKKAAIVVPAAAAVVIAIIALVALMPPAPDLPNGNSTGSPPPGNSTNGDKIPINVLSSPSAFPFVDKWMAQYNSGPHLGTAGADYDREADSIADYSNVTGFLADNSADLAVTGRAPSGWGNSTITVPVSAQAIAIVYNVPSLPDVPSGLKLDAATLVGIFSGNITRWDDPIIRDKNPDLALPAEGIVVVHEGRSDSASDLLEKYTGNATAWPADSLVADSPEDLSATVRQTPYSIGYIDFAYAVQTRMTYAALANADGEYVLPSIDSIGRAVQNGTAVQGNGTDLSTPPVFSTGQLGSGSYPIVGFYYLVLDGTEHAPGSPGQEKATAALDFASWAAGDDGQRILVDMQYPWIYDQSPALAGYEAELQSRYNSTLLMNSTTAVNFTDNPDDSVYGQVVAAGGRVYVVWQESIEDGNYDILFRSSSDAGATFDNATNISDNIGFSEHPQLAVSRDVHVVWPDDASGSRQVMYARDSGQGFGEPVTIGGEGSFNAELAAFEDSVYAVWQDSEAIVLRVSSDAGETFGEPVTITTSGLHAESYPKVAAYGNDVHVAWLAGDGVYYSKSTDAGATFSEPVKLSEEQAGEAQVAAQGGRVYVVWGGSHSAAADGVYVAKSSDGGSTFSAPARIEGSLDSPMNVELAISPEGMVYVAAQVHVASDGESRNEEIMLVSSADGIAFTEAQNLSNNPGISECPSVSVSEGRVYVVWEDGTTGNHEVFLAQRPA